MLCLVGLISIIAICGCLGGNSVKIPAPNTTEPLTVDSIKNILPNDEGNDLINISSNGSVLVTRDLKDNLNRKMMLTGARLDTIAIFKNLFEDPQVERVGVTSTRVFRDAYGQPSLEMATGFVMSRKTYQRINWDYFEKYTPPENLENVADYAYINPWFYE